MVPLAKPRPESASRRIAYARALSRPRVAVIYNPAAGLMQRRRLGLFIKTLRRRGHDVILRKTERPAHATELAQQLASGSDGPIDAIVAAGGDGTINEVANGLIGATVPLAIAPLGTANVMAWELGHGLGIRRAARLVEDGEVVALRPAIASGRRFMLMASAGLDARTVAGVNKRLKRMIGKSAYVLAALKELTNPPGEPIRLQLDGENHEAALAVVTKARHYAGPFIIAPDAKLSDPTLTVIMISDPRRWALFRAALALAFGDVSTLPFVTLRRAERVRIEAPANEPIQSDGDIIGAAPMDIEVGTGSIRLIVRDPKTVA